MPQLNGMPTAVDVIAKLTYAAPDDLPDGTLAEVAQVLTSVQAEFQSPPGFHGVGGGTGRCFETICEQRFFDGNGYPELLVDDVIPGTAFQVKAFDALYPDVLLKQGQNGQGRWNLLVRPQSSGSILGASYGLSGLFPLGLQNIAVTAFWGVVAGADVFQAILSEVVYRLLIEGFIGLDGVGDKVQIGTFEVDTSAMSSNWVLSATPPLLHKTYTDCVSAYRDRGNKAWKRAAQTRRMS